MQEIFEISDRLIEAGDANVLLYEPLEGGLTFRRTRRYVLEFEGDKSSASAFVEKTLFDEISQELHQGETPALSDFTFAVEYGMKPGALDLEKEAILNYYQKIEEPGFELKSLTIRQRIYVFGGEAHHSDRFVKDVCNVSIHNWSIISAA